MQKYILFLDENFSSHPKKDLCIRILTLLSYVETNQEAVIEAFKRKQSLFRHPDNHLAIHIGQYESVKQLEDYLNTLLGEVHGCFRSLIEHHAQYPHSKIFHSFLSNIEDSSTGCMEFRLRRALTFASFSFSQGFAVESLDSVMETAKKVSRDSVIEDILDLFAEKIEYHYPIQLKDDRVPLSWPLVLDYFQTIFFWDEINSDWAKFGKKNFPVFECQGKWVFYYFADPIAAKRYLSYIKATLPHSESDLNKINVEGDGAQYYFKLNLTQHAQFKASIKGIKQKEAKSDLIIDQGEWVLYCFGSAEKAIEKLGEVKSSLMANHPTVGQARVVHTPAHVKTPYRFRLTKEQYQSLVLLKRPQKVLQTQVHVQGLYEALNKINHICIDNDRYQITFNTPEQAKGCAELINARLQKQVSLINLINKNQLTITQDDYHALSNALRAQAKTFEQEDDCVIKSLRGDTKNFFHSLIDELVNGIPFPKRRGPQRLFTVMGYGVCARNPHPEVPLKQAQYTPEQKRRFTNSQSASLLLAHKLYPKPFGFGYRDDLLICFLFQEKDILLSDRLSTKDFGSRNRPCEFDDLASARRYYASKAGEFFHSQNYADYKLALLNNPKTRHSEPLVRLRWNCDGSSRIAICGQTLETRILAWQYAQALTQTLKKANQCPEDYQVPLCFYHPDQKEYLFKEYTKEQYLLDALEALAIFNTPELKQEKYQNQHFEYLLALPEEILRKELLAPYNGIPLGLYILTCGYTHLFRFLKEKTQLSFDVLFGNKLSPAQTSTIFRNALRYRYKDLVDYIYPNVKSSPVNKPQVELIGALTWAIENNESSWITEIMGLVFFDINAQDEDGNTALTVAASCGSIEIVQLLLEKVADIEARNKHGNTALTLAAWYGHIEIVRLLLEADLGAKNKIGRTALALAAMRDYTETVRLLLDRGADIEAKDNDGDTALALAAWLGHTETVLFLLDRGADIEAKDKTDSTALAIAAYNGHTKTVQLLLDRGADIEAKDKIGHTALTLAARNGHTKIVQLLQRMQCISKLKSINAFYPSPDLMAASSIAIKIATLFKAYVNAPFFSASFFSGRSHTQIASTIVNYLMNNPYLSYAQCMTYIKGRTSHLSYSPVDTFAGLIFLAESWGNKANDDQAQNQSMNLSLAASRGEYEVVKGLLLTTNIDTRDDHHNTALIIAALNGHKAIVELLLKQGANIEMENRDGHTALTLAKEQGHQEIVELIEHQIKARPIYQQVAQLLPATKSNIEQPNTAHQIAAYFSAYADVPWYSWRDHTKIAAQIADHLNKNSKQLDYQGCLNHINTQLAQVSYQKDDAFAGILWKIKAMEEESVSQKSDSLPLSMVNKPF